MCSSLTSEAKRRGSESAVVLTSGGVGSSDRPLQARDRAREQALARRSRHDSHPASRKVHDEGRAPEAGDPPREKRVRSTGTSVGTNRLGDPGCFTIENGARRLGGDVARREPVPPSSGRGWFCPRGRRSPRRSRPRRPGRHGVRPRIHPRRSSASVSPLRSSRVPWWTPSETVSTAAFIRAPWSFRPARRPRSSSPCR